MLHMKPYEPITAVALALLVAVLAVRALGETDLVIPLRPGIVATSLYLESDEGLS